MSTEVDHLDALAFAISSNEVGEYHGALGLEVDEKRQKDPSAGIVSLESEEGTGGRGSGYMNIPSNSDTGGLHHGNTPSMFLP